jgi:hypothetical protein
MSRWMALTLSALALSGCASQQNFRHEPPRVVYSATSNGFPNVPNRPKRSINKIIHQKLSPKSAETVVSPKEQELALLPKYSPEWWKVHDAIELDEDAKLAKVLIICRGCSPPKDEDQTGSIK